MAAAEHVLQVELTKDTTYLILLGEIWDVHCDNFGKKMMAL